MFAAVDGNLANPNGDELRTDLVPSREVRRRVLEIRPNYCTVLLGRPNVSPAWSGQGWKRSVVAAVLTDAF